MNKETLRMQILAGVITEGQYKAKLKENTTAEELFQMFKDEDLLNDRRYYDVEDFMWAHPDLSEEEAKKLEQMLQNPTNLKEQYKAKLKENKKSKSKKSLKENFVGMGAINNPFAKREKTGYETAFEHFLGEKYELKEEMDEVEDAFSSPSDTNPVAQDYLKQLMDMLNNQTDDMFDLKNLKYAVDKFSNMINNEIAKFEVEEGKEVEEPNNY
jgi:hypothetical protein